MQTKAVSPISASPEIFSITRLYDVFGLGHVLPLLRIEMGTCANLSEKARSFNVPKDNGTAKT